MYNINIFYWALKVILIFLIFLFYVFTLFNAQIQNWQILLFYLNPNYSISLNFTILHFIFFLNIILIALYYLLNKIN